MSLHVHFIDEDINEHYLQLLQSRISNDVVITVGEDLSSVADYDILIAGVPEENHITHSQNLHALIIPWAGLPKKTAELMLNYPSISIHNIHHNDQTTAEMTFALMITVMKRIIPIDRDLRKSNWERRYNDEPILLLKDKRVVVLGYGAIGQKVVKMCQAFDMQVSIVSRTIKDIENSSTIDKLPTLLPSCDVLLITLPLTKETENLISKERLSLLSDNCTIVNIARGKVIDEKALYNELKSGRLRAGIDVWYKYPMTEEERKHTPVSNFPFHELDNVVMTPHLAGHSDVVEDLRIDALAKLINQASNGEELDNKIDLDLGY